MAADGTTIASNSSFTSLSDVLLEIDSSGSNSGNTDLTGDGDDELTVAQGATETVNVTVTTTSGADADGDTLVLDTTTNLISDGQSSNTDVVVFSTGSALTATATSGTLSLDVSDTTSPRGVPLDSDGNFIIGDGDRVFQGQDALNFSEGGTTFDTLTGASGDAEGQVLSVPIPEDQQVGTYTNGGEPVSTADIAVTVDQPRITDFELLNQNDEDILGGSVADTNADDLTVAVDYNYNRYEALDLTIEDDGGLEIQGDVVTSTNPAFPEGGAGDRSVEFDVDLSDEDAGTYTITVEGEDELDFGSAVESGTIELTSEDNVRLNLGSSDVTQGDNVRYEVTGSVAGDYHLVTIDENEFRDGASINQQARIFRNVQDVEERGLITETDGNPDDQLLHETDEIPSSLPSGRSIDAAYAIVVVDDDTGLGVGSIDTTALDDSTVTVDVSDRLNTTDGVPSAFDGSARALGDNDGSTGVGPVGTTGGPEPFVEIDGDVDTDDVDLSVDEGDVTLDSPGNTYVVGSEVTLNGSAPTGIDDVAIYARDEGDFELVEIDGDSTVSVDVDGGFEEEDIVLSEGDAPGNDILSLPGSYRIGVIDATDADNDDDEEPDDTLTTSEFNSGTSSQRSIRVLGQGLNAEFTSVIRGQIAVEDGTVDINGSAPGANEVLFIAIDSRGDISTQTVSVESDQTFDEEDISIDDLNEGAISLHVFSVGRDGVYGDTDEDLDAFQTFVDDLEDQSLTADQVRSRLLDASIEAAGSDDLIVNLNARLVDAQTNIVSVYQDGNQASGVNPVTAGETLVVEGQTNLKPDDNTITAELQSEDVSVGLASVDDWEQDGSFTLSIDTADAATGTYTLELDDGENTVTEEVELVESIDTPTPTETEADDTPTTTPTATPTTTPTATSTEMDTDTPTPTEGGGPGFGAVVALVALLAAALLATRRHDN